MLSLDHFAIGCADLKVGIAQISTLLEVPPIVQAKHELFSTHNALWRLETALDPIYLELIAVDLYAPKPARIRWFGLDDPAVQRRFSNGPQLLTFVVNTPDFSAARQKMTVDPGEPVAVTRNDLKWQFSLHNDGRLVADGALPYVIQWAPGPRPVDKMAFQNIELVAMGGARLAALDMVFPCPICQSDEMLEMTLKLPSGKQISLSTQN